jgi:hypothetical protein
MKKTLRTWEDIEGTVSSAALLSLLTFITLAVLDIVPLWELVAWYTLLVAAGLITAKFLCHDPVKPRIRRRTVRQPDPAIDKLLTQMEKPYWNKFRKEQAKLQGHNVK